MKLHEAPSFLDNDKTMLMLPETWVDYLTFGFNRESVIEKLRKKHKKLKGE
jgi:hypothetical protein